MPLIPAFGRQRQVDLCDLEASLVYRASSRQAPKLQRNPVSKTKAVRTKMEQSCGLVTEPQVSGEETRRTLR